MGVPVNNPGSNRENCPKISSACVIWQGPNIPCINLCAGDAIDEVVFKLATLLCTISEGIVDVSALDFQCILDPTSQQPTNLQDSIQLIIDYICSSGNASFLRTANPLLAKSLSTFSTGDVLPLPQCLYYTDENNDLITALPQSEYIVYVATKLCDLTLTVSLHTGSINALNTRVNALQAAIDAIPPSSSTDIYIISQCASSYAPNLRILIQDAFTNLERNYCNLLSTLGTTDSIINGVNRQIPNLSNLPQLVNTNLYMRQIPGWIPNPNGIGNSLANLWLTVNDIRTRLQIYINEIVTIPCILALPENLEITTIASLYSTLVFDSPNLGGIERPLSYQVEVYDLTDTLFTNPLFSTIIVETNFQKTVNIISGNLVPNVDYRINVVSIYTCGTSNPSFIISKLLTLDNLYTVVVGYSDTTSIMLCDGKDEISLITSDLTLTLVTISGGIPVKNLDAEPIIVKVRFQTLSCGSVEPITQDVDLEILFNTDSVTYSFVKEQGIICNNGTCGLSVTSLSCGVSISQQLIEFTGDLLPCV
jgi:hypothetical protein